MTGDPHDDGTPADLADEVSAWAAKLAVTPDEPAPEPDPEPDADDDQLDLAADDPAPDAEAEAEVPEDAEPEDGAVDSGEVVETGRADAEHAAAEDAEPDLFADGGAGAPEDAGTEEPVESGEPADVDAADDGADDSDDAADAADREGVHPEGATPVDGDTEGSEAGVAFEDGERDDAEPAPDLAAALEAVLMVVDEPIPTVQFAQVLETPRVEVEATLRRLAEEYTESGRGFDLREVAGGWRFYSRPECAPVVERFILDGQQARLTQAALETLAVIAYRQPVSRARVSAIRGVNCDGVIRTLVSRGLIEEAGTEEDSNALLYRTTMLFLERLGLQSVDDLPDIAPYLPEVDEFTDTEDVPG